MHTDRPAAVDRAEASRRRDDVHVMSGSGLSARELADLELDPAEARQVEVGDVCDPHAATVGQTDPVRAFTVVSFHAHPDDEVLLTGGTLARAAAAGHRVVLVTATGGGAGLAAAEFGTGSDLATVRRRELDAAAAVLGCRRVEVLGYADSGMDGRSGGESAFVRAPTAAAARRLAALLREEQADVLTLYDPRGGYGHPDHVAVHRVGVEAARLAGTPVVLEATVDRTSLWRAARVAGHLPGVPPDFAHPRLATAFTARAEITHVVDVRTFCAQKRAAMRCHATQATGGRDGRTLAVFGRLPLWLFRRVLGREWFVEHGRAPAPPIDDIFATLR
jgi:LmbE family N-acetylglucosaminyl deacetylase